MSTPPSGVRHPGQPVPHVAISREERDLAHAGYEICALKLAAMPPTPHLFLPAINSLNIPSAFFSCSALSWIGITFLSCSAFKTPGGLVSTPGREGMRPRLVSMVCPSTLRMKLVASRAALG